MHVDVHVWRLTLFDRARLPGRENLDRRFAAAVTGRELLNEAAFFTAGRSEKEGRDASACRGCACVPSHGNADMNQNAAVMA